jgi:2,5-dioxopentanoate dehydrogenase
LDPKEVTAEHATFRAMDASTGTAIEPPFIAATLADVDRACAAAWTAFESFRRTGLEERASFLEAIADNIVGIGDALIVRAMTETGLPRQRLEGERQRTVNQLRFFAAVVRRGSWLTLRVDTAQPERTPPRPDLRMRKIPLGPVAVFGASNFPLAFSVAGGDTASAFAAGCPVIVKGHPAHPGVSDLVARAIAEAVAACPRAYSPCSPVLRTTSARHSLPTRTSKPLDSRAREPPDWRFARLPPRGPSRSPCTRR